MESLNRRTDEFAGTQPEETHRALPPCLHDGSFVSVRRGREPEIEPVWSDCSPRRSWGMRHLGGNEFGETEEFTRSADEFVRVDSAYGTHSFACAKVIAARRDPPSIYVSRGDRNEIHQFSPDGVLLRIIRRTTDPLPVTAKALRAREERMTRSWAERDRPPPEAQLEMTRSVEVLPAIAGLMMDAEGYLWVTEYSESEIWLADQWSIFSPEGRWLGVVTDPGTPGSTGLLPCSSYRSACWIDRNFFLVLGRDQFDVERVEAYRIRRGG